MYSVKYVVLLEPPKSAFLPTLGQNLSLSCLGVTRSQREIYKQFLKEIQLCVCILVMVM